MTTPIIEVHNVSKVFSIQTKQVSLRHEAYSYMRTLFRQQDVLQHETFHALNNISFDIQRGESVGIVGRNGAGKTTLLRILSRIIRPTTGHVEVHGSYASLIGLGAGFLDTMSGRKNIYLNAAIHGVTPEEVEQYLDDIITFADIGKYIDMPVKDYSSGMRARLGFSVAIHILPDIVFLDEVLSVGDSAFKEKSGNKLEAFLNENRTVIFVSHASESVTRICKRAIWIHNGEIKMDDSAIHVVKEYEAFMAHQR